MDVLETQPMTRSTTYIGSVNLVAQLADRAFAFGQIALIAAALGATAGADTYFLAGIVPLTIGFVIGDPLGRAMFTLLVRVEDERAALSAAAAGFLASMAFLMALTIVYVAAAATVVTIITPSGSADLTPWLLFAIAAPASGLSGYLSGILLWRHRYAWPALRTPLTSGSALALSGAAAAAGGGVASIAAAVSSAYVIAVGVLFVEVRRSVGRGWLRRATRHGVREAFRIRGKLAAPTMAGVVGGQVIVLLERTLAGTLATGYVAVIAYARGLATAPTVIAQAVGAASYPSLVRADARRSDEYVFTAVVRGLRLSLLVGSLLATFLLLFGADVAAAVLQRGELVGAAADHVGDVVIAFALTALGGSIIAFLAPTLYALDRFLGILLFEGAIFVAYVLLAPPLRLIHDLEGLAAAYAIAQAVGVVTALVVVSRRVGRPLVEIVRPATLPIVPSVATVACALGGFRLLVDRIDVPIAWLGVVRVGGATSCLALAAAVIVATSRLPELQALRSNVRRRLV